MKSYTILTLTAVLASAAYAYKDEQPASRPGIQIETRPPVVIIETVTRTKIIEPHPTGHGHGHGNDHGHGHWNPDKHHNNTDDDDDEEDYHHNKHDDEDDDDEDDDDHHKGYEKNDWADIHANSVSAKSSEPAKFEAAAQLSSFASSIKSVAASKTSAVASKASSAAASASSKAVANSNGNNLRVGGAFVAGAAGIAAYLVL